MQLTSIDAHDMGCGVRRAARARKRYDRRRSWSAARRPKAHVWRPCSRPQHCHVHSHSICVPGMCARSHSPQESWHRCRTSSASPLHMPTCYNAHSASARSATCLTSTCRTWAGSGHDMCFASRPAIMTRLRPVEAALVGICAVMEPRRRIGCLTRWLRDNAEQEKQEVTVSERVAQEQTTPQSGRQR